MNSVIILWCALSVPEKKRSFVLNYVLSFLNAKYVYLLRLTWMFRIIVKSAFQSYNIFVSMHFTQVQLQFRTGNLDFFLKFNELCRSPPLSLPLQQISLCFSFFSPVIIFECGQFHFHLAHNSNTFPLCYIGNVFSSPLFAQLSSHLT